MEEIISDTEKLRKQILKSAKTISDQSTKKLAEEWLKNYYIGIRGFSEEIGYKKVIDAVEYLKISSANNRLIRINWLASINVILRSLKENKYTKSTESPNNQSDDGSVILPNEILDIIKLIDNKIYLIGLELNYNWQSGKCWNSCGILMRIILERALDKKGPEIKKKNGLKDKINFCLSSNLFGRSISEALKKLDNSTKITGDIVAHDSNIVLDKTDIELSIVPFKLLLKDIFTKTESK